VWPIHKNIPSFQPPLRGYQPMRFGGIMKKGTRRYSKRKNVQKKKYTKGKMYKRKNVQKKKCTKEKMNKRKNIQKKNVKKLEIYREKMYNRKNVPVQKKNVQKKK
jgi:hypothetical protein